MGKGVFGTKTLIGVWLALLISLPVLLPGGEAPAQTRAFQMSLWECCSAPSTPTSAETDLHSFGDGGVAPGTCPSPFQPAGRSIMVNLQYAQPLSTLFPPSIHCIDWSRIVAVEVDEPFASVDNYLNQSSCTESDPEAIAAIASYLQARAAELNALNSKARFWVDFTSREASWMAACGATAIQVLNRPYFDIVSENQYNQQLTSFSNFYTEISENPATPSQQVAYIPGVFSAPTDQSIYLGSFIESANEENQTCNLPLGTRGVTGIYDGCPVWIVMGWMTGDQTQDGETYVGILEPGSESILAAWQTYVAYTPSRQRPVVQFLPAIIQML